MIFAIDFETYYDKHVSISAQGVYHYLHDAACDIYLVAVYSDEAQYAYVGEPQGMDWARLHGQELVAHNARFDEACFDRLKELGVIAPSITPSCWHCTADMSVFFGAGRNLAEAARTLLGVNTVDKTPREDMLGKTWLEARMLGWSERLAEYCLHDAWLCYRIWTRWADRWPEWERRLSRLTRSMCREGIAVDRARLQTGLQKLGSEMSDALLELPWVPEQPPLSPKALRQECVKAGIPAPATLAEGSPACARWELLYGSSYRWVAAMRNYRKANTLSTKLQTLESRLIGDVFPYALKYYGAHTGRWSGDAGFNVQNLPRAAQFGVDLRGMFVPRPGHTFIISDLGQIEQRVLSWLAGDNRMMEVLETGVSVYEAHARATMGWTGGSLKHENPQLYRLAKARVLGLGYGAGAAVFVQIAKTMAGLDIEMSQAQRVVAEYRRTNPLITDLWRRLDRAFALAQGRAFNLPLPPGRRLIYRNVQRPGSGYSADLQGRRVSFFGGKLTENLTSATARDVLGHSLLRCADAGLRVVLHVHDEVVVEVPTAELDTAVHKVESIMTTTPDWLTGLPLSAETFTSTQYTK